MATRFYTAREQLGKIPNPPSGQYVGTITTQWTVGDNPVYTVSAAHKKTGNPWIIPGVREAAQRDYRAGAGRLEDDTRVILQRGPNGIYEITGTVPDGYEDEASVRSVGVSEQSISVDAVRQEHGDAELSLSTDRQGSANFHAVAGKSGFTANADNELKMESDDWIIANEGGIGKFRRAGVPSTKDLYFMLMDAEASEVEFSQAAGFMLLPVEEIGGKNYAKLPAYLSHTFTVDEGAALARATPVGAAPVGTKSDWTLTLTDVKRDGFWDADYTMTFSHAGGLQQANFDDLEVVANREISITSFTDTTLVLRTRANRNVLGAVVGRETPATGAEAITNGLGVKKSAFGFIPSGYTGHWASHEVLIEEQGWTVTAATPTVTALPGTDAFETQIVAVMSASGQAIEGQGLATFFERIEISTLSFQLRSKTGKVAPSNVEWFWWAGAHYKPRD